MTRDEAKAILNAIGVSIKRTVWEEYRVCIRGEGEERAYYTDDLEDAVGTGKAMVEARRKEKVMIHCDCCDKEIETPAEWSIWRLEEVYKAFCSRECMAVELLVWGLEPRGG